ncbi:PhzF family phenazine biosynthesis protein [candidate division WOR-3 bacterium]|uniref:PhzF family phenazine biosynthesis protein n=1 Tax=candidate division WOR-3 bacterium TaxID=2052148 RepID=A0A938BP45_UNCW3|nr:PhzF family phenazine biosynthesis protein [candidate division WOR-3 bacterium]
MSRHFIICDVFARRRFEGNQLAVFPDAAGMPDEEMQALAREIHFSETTFILSDRPNERGWPVRIFTPAREVPFAGHPTLGTAFVIWDRFLGRSPDKVDLDLGIGTVPVAVEENGERLMMTQVPPVFGAAIDAPTAAGVLGLAPSDIDNAFPVQEVSTGLPFVIVPVRTLAAVQGIKVNQADYCRLTDRLEAKAVLAFAPETIDPQCRLHVRVFCDYYDVPEDPATGSANGCLCAWLVRHRYLGTGEFAIYAEQGIEIKRPSLLYLQGGERDGGILVRVGGRVVVAGRGQFDP